MNILEISGLTKHYADKTALDNVSFNVEAGSICGLLGPNGAGNWGSSDGTAEEKPPCSESSTPYS